VLSANHQNEPLSLKREKRPRDDMHAYNRRELKRLFGLSSATIQLLEQTGYLDPQTSGCYEFRRPRATADRVGALHAAKLSARTINRALRHLKPWLSGEAHKGPISLRARHDRVQAQQGGSLWEPQSGQYVLPLEVDIKEPRVLTMKSRAPPIKPKGSARMSITCGVWM